MPVRIATFNLENLDDRAGLEPPLDERVAWLRPQLFRLAADVLCLQEINGQRVERGAPRRLAALDRLLETTPYAGFARAVTTGPHGRGVADVHNLVILSRWPILDSESHRHDLVRPPLYEPATADPSAAGPRAVEWDRPVLAATIDAPGGHRLHIVNLHLRAPLAAPIEGQKTGPFAWKSIAGWAEGFFVATIKRCGQALETRLLVERIFDAEPEALIVVCGDFNAEEREMPLRIIRGDVEDTGNGGLVSRSLVPLERTLPDSQRFTVRHGGRKVMLDHVLVSHGLLAHYRHLEAHNEALGDELVAYATVSRSPESYHAPVVAEFELPTA